VADGGFYEVQKILTITTSLGLSKELFGQSSPFEGRVILGNKMITDIMLKGLPKNPDRKQLHIQHPEFRIRISLLRIILLMPLQFCDRGNF